MVAIIKYLTFVLSQLCKRNQCHATEAAKTRGVRVNYRKLAGVDEKLPRKSPQLSQGRDTYDGGALYPISLVNRGGTHVLIHYVGYESHFDEWREERDFVKMPFPCLATECYDLHQDLTLKIKASLTSNRKSNPV